MSLFDSDKKVITEENFLEVYEYWESFFGKYVDSDKKASEYFISDIEIGKSHILSESDGSVAFDLGEGNAKIKFLPIKDYIFFWDIYEKVDDINVIYAIRQKIDRISEDYQRRFTGEFYTPIDFADKALNYIERIVGSKWYEKDNWRLWDMAAGTGNLEFTLPTSALKKCYISSLLEDDVNYCKRIFPAATVFQYDYLNDDINLLANPDLSKLGLHHKMPEQLVDDLKNPDLKWIIFINPPFATSNTAGLTSQKKSKDNVSMTKIREMMDNEGLGEVSRELFSQFLYRIHKEFQGRDAYLGLFSKIKYINSNNDQKFRDKIFKYKFESGFIMSSKNFHGLRGQFPIGFLVWNLGKEKKLESQNITLDIFNNECEKYGTKKILIEDRSKFLNKWVKRPKTTKVFPPFSSAINISAGNKDIRDKVSDDFLCSLMCCGNDVYHQNQTALLSGPYGSAGGYSVNKENFEHSMVIHAVRRIIKQSWTNDRDQFLIPHTSELEEEFINDCVIWSAFSDSNNTVSIKEIKYCGNNYQIDNHLYPFLLSEVRQWNITLSPLLTQIISANEDRYLAQWIDNHKISEESNLILEKAKSVYKKFYKCTNQGQWLDYKIGLWDVGWWQVKMLLSEIDPYDHDLIELNKLHKKLSEKLLPQIYKFGFLSEEVNFYEED
ncbi:hypothetical protein HS086_06805 [Turicibacter sp. PIG517]|nr:hypothetical protein [Turicibacter bilis]MDY4814513.1 hypothetical protein [Turicibacter bilis]